MLLAAAKRVVKLDHAMRSGEFEPCRTGSHSSREVVPLRGRRPSASLGTEG